MPDYRNIVDGLREMVRYSPEHMQLIVNRLAQTISKSLYSETDGINEREALMKELAILTEDERIVRPETNNIHIFEFDKDTCWMLDMTDNQRKDEEIHIPFPAVFLDVDVDIIGVRHTGILLVENEGIILSSANPGRGFESCQSLAWAREHLEELPPGAILCPIPHLTAIIYAPTKGLADNPIMPYMVRRYALLPIMEKMTLPHSATLDGEEMEVEFSFGVPNRDRLKEYKSIERIVMNFLDLLDTPDVRIAHVPRKEDSQVRVKRGKIAYPPRERVMLTLPIKHYIEEARSNGQMSYNHAFWVRGHFRHFRSERYAKSGLQGTKEWIPPYIKGKGILVKKKYDVETKFSTV